MQGSAVAAGLPRARGLDRVATALSRRLRRRSGFEARMARLYAEFMREGDLVFDVGANVGHRTRTFRSLGARVLAIEPQRPCVAELHEQFDDDPGVVVLPVAVAARAGTRTLWSGDDPRLASISDQWLEAVTRSRRFGSHAWSASEIVQTVTLDEVIERWGPPAFIKLDVEGSEPEALAGLSCAPSALSFEVHGEFLAGTRGCIERLEALGARRFAFSFAESCVLGPWGSAEALWTELDQLDGRYWGDVYATWRHGAG